MTDQPPPPHFQETSRDGLSIEVTAQLWAPERMPVNALAHVDREDLLAVAQDAFGSLADPPVAGFGLALIDPKTGSVERVIETNHDDGGHSVTEVLYLPAPHMLAYSRMRLGVSNLVLYDIASDEKMVLRTTMVRHIDCLSASAGGELLALVDDFAVRLIDLSKIESEVASRELQEPGADPMHSGEVVAALSSDGGTVAIARGQSRTLVIYDAADCSEPTGIIRAAFKEVHRLAFAPGRPILYGIYTPDNPPNVLGASYALGRWDVVTGTQLPFGDADSCFTLCFDAQQRFMAAAGYEGSVSLFDAEHGEKIHWDEAHSGRIYTLGFDASGARLFSAGDDGQIAVRTISG